MNGKKQGFSLCLWDYEKLDFKWIGKSLELGLPNDHLLSPYEIIEFFVDKEEFKYDDYQIVLAIDAPLGYPKDFVKFINGDNIIKTKPESEIKNLIAYRETERHIYKVFGKKSLWTTFDKIGNNATVAISHIRMWSENHKFTIQPAEIDSQKDIIEVYPTLVKENSKVFQLFDKSIPLYINRKSDAYDSAICALMGLKYYVGYDLFNFPLATKPPQREPYDSEGWIYYVDTSTN